MNVVLEKVVCNLCGSVDCTELDIGLPMAKEEIQAFGIDKPSWVMCNRCALLYQSPRLTHAMWSKYYEESFYREVQSNKEVEAGYISYSYIQMQKVEGWLHANGITISGDFPRSYLDYGCGIGGTLKYLRDKGCQSVNGIEVDPFLIEEGKRIFDVDISTGFDDPRLEGKTFDLVYTHHCLEHVMDLNEFFSHCQASLEENGHLVVVVPTYKHGNVAFDYGTSIAHNFILTHHTLRAYLEKHGLTYVNHAYRKTRAGADNELWCIARKSSDATASPVECDEDVVKEELREINVIIPRRIWMMAIPNFVALHVWQRSRPFLVRSVKAALPAAMFDMVKKAKTNLADRMRGRK